MRLEGASLSQVEAGTSVGHHKMDKKVWSAQLLTVQSQRQRVEERPSGEEPPPQGRAMGKLG